MTREDIISDWIECLKNFHQHHTTLVPGAVLVTTNSISPRPDNLVVVKIHNPMTILQLIVDPDRGIEESYSVESRRVKMDGKTVCLPGRQSWIPSELITDEVVTQVGLLDAYGSFRSEDIRDTDRWATLCENHTSANSLYTLYKRGWTLRRIGQFIEDNTNAIFV